MVKIIDETITTYNKGKTFIIEINGKTINAWKWQSYDHISDEYDGDLGVDDKDAVKLEEEELDEVINYLEEIKL